MGGRGYVRSGTFCACLGDRFGALEENVILGRMRIKKVGFLCREKPSYLLLKACAIALKGL
jgi:hypothetical protein